MMKKIIYFWIAAIVVFLLFNKVLYAATPTPSMAYIKAYVLLKTPTAKNTVEDDIPAQVATCAVGIEHKCDAKGCTITALIGSNMIKPAQTKIANYPNKIQFITWMYVPSPTITPTATPTVIK